MISNRLRAWGLPAGPNMRMRLLGCLLLRGAELLKFDCGIDVVAQQDLACVGVAGKQGFDSFAQQALPKCRVASGAGLHGCLKSRVRDMRSVECSSKFY